MEKNYMEQVAKMLGLKWNDKKGESEEFEIDNPYCGHVCKLVAKYPGAVWKRKDFKEDYEICDHLVYSLLTELSVIKKI